MTCSPRSSCSWCSFGGRSSKYYSLGKRSHNRSGGPSRENPTRQGAPDLEAAAGVLAEDLGVVPILGDRREGGLALLMISEVVLPDPLRRADSVKRNVGLVIGIELNGKEGGSLNETDGIRGDVLHQVMVHAASSSTTVLRRYIVTIPSNTRAKTVQSFWFNILCPLVWVINLPLH